MLIFYVSLENFVAISESAEGSRAVDAACGALTGRLASEL